jgi:hypothetical protein
LHGARRYFAGNSEASHETVGKVNGCGSQETATPYNPSPPGEKSYAYLRWSLYTAAGTGPSNPYCMSIFDPSWRLDEWVVAQYLEARFQFHPFPMLIAGLVLVCVGLVGTCFFGAGLSDVNKKLADAKGQASATSSISTSSSAASTSCA